MKVFFKLLAISAAFLIPVALFSQTSRLALVIGNSNYQNAGYLMNPVNDARDIGQALRNTGFTVLEYNNMGLIDMKRAIDDFGLKLRDFEVGLFYYAGHGIQAKGVNYLVPVDAKIYTENDVEYNCVDVGRMLAKMEDARSKTNIVILDACRDNPFERSWTRSTKGGGLAFMNAPTGSLIAYATSPGTTASDGGGENGLYTSAILNYIYEPDVSILQMFQKVRREVREVSKGTQIPWETTSLEGDFYIAGRTGVEEGVFQAAAAGTALNKSQPVTTQPGEASNQTADESSPEAGQAMDPITSYFYPDNVSKQSTAHTETPTEITGSYLAAQRRNFLTGQPCYFNKFSSSSWTKGTINRLYKKGYFVVGFANKRGKVKTEIVSKDNLILGHHKHIPSSPSELSVDEAVIFFTPYDKIITYGKVISITGNTVRVLSMQGEPAEEFSIPLESILVLDRKK